MGISPEAPIGIMGIGRMGKLLVWLYASKKKHDEIVIATGRKTGTSLDDLATYFEYDSTYGSFDAFVGGFGGKNAVSVSNGNLYLNGVKILWLSEQDYRIPGKIPWNRYGVEVVFDTTGKMLDPTRSDENSLRGHCNHAKKVILTAPFKVKDKGKQTPDDSITLVGGVNFDKYDSNKHTIISNASCTTNCCAPPIKALVDYFGDKFISYSLTTVHAVTNSQAVLDTLPKDGDKDTRKRRSILNNMIPTSTGAAKAVLEVIPEVQALGIGSQASSIRVPVNTGSIVILDISLLGSYDNEYVHAIFKQYSEKNPDVMYYSEKQLVSSDIIGSPYSTVYDAPFTHRRTTKRGDNLYTMVDLNFWYDNEFGYVCSLYRLYDLVTGRR